MNFYEYFDALFGVHGDESVYVEWQTKGFCKHLLLGGVIVLIVLWYLLGFTSALNIVIAAVIVIGLIANLLTIILKTDNSRINILATSAIIWIASGFFIGFQVVFIVLVGLLAVTPILADFRIIKTTHCIIINRELRAAVLNNNFKRVKSLYRRGCINWDPHVHEYSSFYSLNPILNTAIDNADQKITALLLTHPKIAIHERRNSSTVGGERSHGPTPLEMAVKKGSLELVKLLLDHPRMTAQHAASAYEIASKNDIKEAFENFFKQRIAVPKKVTRWGKKITVYGDRGCLLFNIPKDWPGDRVKKATIKNNVVIIETEAEKVFEYAYQIFSGDFRWREISPLSSIDVQKTKVFQPTTADIPVTQAPEEPDAKAQQWKQKRKQKEELEKLKTQARVKAAEERRKKMFEQTKAKTKKK